MRLLTYLASPWVDANDRPSSHGDDVRALHGIRGLAVLIVMAAHTGALGLTTQGSVGVFLFFALSGFVLALPFADRPERIFRPREVWFYFVSRALRIIPAFVVAVLLIAGCLQQPWSWIWLNVSFQAGWNHLWSVAEEVRFYLLFPVAVAALACLRSRAWRIVALVVMIVVTWVFSRNFLRVGLMIDAGGGPSVPFYFYLFLTGMLACLLYRELERRGISGNHIADGAALLAVAALFFVDGWEHAELWGAIFLVLLVAAASSESALTTRLLQSWVMRHIGLLSYSLYLYHYTVSTWLWSFGLRASELFMTTFVVTYLIAIASYLVAEKPFLIIKSRLRRSRQASISPAALPIP